MRSNSKNIDELMLDDLLGQLEPEGRQVLQQRLGEPEVRQRAERLQRLLSPLDSWTVEPAPPELVTRILNQISTRGIRPIRPAASHRPTESESSGRPPVLTLKELMAVAACITLLVGITVPSVSASRERARQAMCRAGLQSTFGGIQRYAADYAGFLPNVGIPEGTSCVPIAGTNVPVRANMTNLIPVLRLRYLANGQVLLCPSDRGAKPFGPVDWNTLDRFPTPPSYSLQHISATTRMPDRPDMPIYSDPNPLFADGRAADKLSPAKANSPTHHGRGQNVLSADGAVRWQTSPTVGPGGDNIWLPGNIARPRGNELPVGPTDVLLKP